MTTSYCYIGCYQDNGSPRDLPNIFSLSSVTIEACITECKTNGYLYAGLQDKWEWSHLIIFVFWFFNFWNFQSHQCFCGNSYGSYGLATNCNMNCAGNTNEICGGYSTNSIYSTQCLQSIYVKFLNKK